MLTAVLVALSGCAADGDRSASSTQPTLTTTTSTVIPRGYLYARGSGILVPALKGWTVVLVDEVNSDPGAVPERIRTIAAERHLTVAEMFGKLEGADIVAFGHTRGGVTPNFSIIPDASTRTLPLASAVETQLEQIGAKNVRVGYRQTSLGKAVWTAIPATSSSVLAQYIVTFAGPTGLVTLSVAHTSAKRARMAAESILAKTRRP